MTDRTVPKPAPPAPAAGGQGAGALLRAARERRGLNVPALAAMAKVTPAKIEALEDERYEALPDLAFARGLAHLLCRMLEIDAAPVLAQMPQPPSLGPGLELVHNGLNAPLRRQRRQRRRLAADAAAPGAVARAAARARRARRST